MNILIKDHQIGVDFWNSKRELFEKFYGAFYQFILEHGGKDDLENNIIASKIFTIMQIGMLMEKIVAMQWDFLFINII